MKRNRRARSRAIRWSLVLGVPLLLLGVAGCATVARGALQAVVDEAVGGDGPRSADGWEPADAGLELAERARPRGSQTSVYRAGPSAGWQSGPGLFGAGRDSPYYRASFFRGHCPALLNIRVAGDRDPFGPVGSNPVEPPDVADNLWSGPDYSRVGRGEYGGLGTPQHAWYPLTLFSNAGNRCGLAGLRLISFGEERVDILHK